MGLLNAVLRQAGLFQFKSLTIKNPLLPENWKNVKESKLDFRVLDEEEREYDVEIRLRLEIRYYGRIVMPTFQLCVKPLKLGEQNEAALKRKIRISFTTFSIDSSFPDLCFDVWTHHSALDAELGFDDATNILVRIPLSWIRQPVGINDPELLNWLHFIAYYPRYLSDEELATIKESAFGITELCREVETFGETRDDLDFMPTREPRRPV